MAGVACSGLQRRDCFVARNQFSDDEWQDSALTHDGSTFRGYIDGRLDSSAEVEAIWDAGSMGKCR